jgi:hypothetical protein
LIHTGVLLPSYIKKYASLFKTPAPAVNALICLKNRDRWTVYKNMILVEKQNTYFSIMIAVMKKGLPGACWRVGPKP